MSGVFGDAFANYHDPKEINVYWVNIQ